MHERVGLQLPAAQVRRGRVADRRAVVAPVGVEQRARGAQEEQVVLAAVGGEPAVPDPVVGEPQHDPDDGGSSASSARPQGARGAPGRGARRPRLIALSRPARRARRAAPRPCARCTPRRPAAAGDEVVPGGGLDARPGPVGGGCRRSSRGARRPSSATRSTARRKTACRSSMRSTPGLAALVAGDERGLERAGDREHLGQVGAPGAQQGLEGGDGRRARALATTWRGKPLALSWWRAMASSRPARLGSGSRRAGATRPRPRRSP